MPGAGENIGVRLGARLALAGSSQRDSRTNQFSRTFREIMFRGGKGELFGRIAGLNSRDRMMGKKNKVKIEANRAILRAIRERGIPYTNMNQASFDLAISMGVTIAHLRSPLHVRVLLLAKLTGQNFQDLVDRNANLMRAAKAAPNSSKPNYLPGLPSASTLERDIKEFYASWEWKRLSFRIKQERGRMCECCGAKAPKVTIHTDHIKPLRKYWHLRLDPANLQVLCEDCNKGKGSHDETDFRLLNALDGAPYEPELSAEEEMRLEAVRDQLRIN